MSKLSDALAEALDDKSDKNYDPRMEELLRSDRIIDPKAENLSKLEDQEIFHIAKLRGAQKGFSLQLKQVKKVYDLPWMQEYHTDYIDYIRSLDKEKDKAELEAFIGGLPMTNEMISQLVYLRGALEAWKAKLYADSIKPQVANVAPMMPMQAEEKESIFGKIANFIFGRKKEEPQGYKR